ncbi:hypothetical protein GGF32_007989 [Allomyces javanicus]|nr:hypothetical protein GGF32_007989 [Allomyces javanicus]
MGGLCSTAKWKREEVPDHKFDFVDLDEYKRTDCWSMVGYSGVFLVTFRSVLVYLADLSTAVLIMAFNQWSTKPPDDIAEDPVLSKSLQKTLGMSPSTYMTLADNLRWVYSGSIVVSFLLLALDTKKSFRIIKSRDISFAFTDTIAYRYYCLRSFAHWCFFQEVRSNHRTSDQIAQFVFFRLKGWKRLIFAETPRHIITAMLLAYQLRMLGLPDKTDMAKWTKQHPNASSNSYKTTFSLNLLKTHVLDVNSLAQQFGVFTMTFVFVMYVFNVLSTLVAAIVYVPLLCKIRGNLKEYVCHLIDKRIGELMRRKARKRIEQQQQELALYGTTKETAETGGPRAELPVLADDTGYAPSPFAYGAAPSPSVAKAAAAAPSPMTYAANTQHSTPYASLGPSAYGTATPTQGYSMSAGYGGTPQYAQAPTQGSPYQGATAGAYDRYGYQQQQPQPVQYGAPGGGGYGAGRSAYQPRQASAQQQQQPTYQYYQDGY